MDLKKIFLGIIPEPHGEKLWDEIASRYSEKGRYYHSLSHLEHLYSELENVRHEISDREVILYALFYHDAIYDPIRTNNEEKSAELAIERLSCLNLNEERTRHCKAIILATKKHEESPDNDTNLFTDADLSILGAEPNTYLEYSRNVRKEYSVYPDLLYNPGRKKVLLHFLGMKNIFKTEVFSLKFEDRARKNLREELEQY